MSKEIVVQPQPRAWLERSSALCFAIWGAPAPRAVCPKHPTHLFVLRCALCPLADRGAVRPERNRRGRRRLLSVGAYAGCVCPYPVRRLRHELRAALARLLEVLRADGVGTLDPALDSVVSQELARFDAHMRDVWGLAPPAGGEVGLSASFCSRISAISRSRCRRSAPHLSGVLFSASRGAALAPSA